MTYVTCPTLRYHPAVVAQKAATVQILSGDRFRLGLGAGENLNEHVVGERWPSVGVRHEMLERGGRHHRRAVRRRRGTVNYRGQALRRRVGPAVGPARRAGADRHRRLGPATPAGSPASKADLMIAVEPEAELGEMFDARRRRGKPRVGQVAVSYDPDRDAAVERAHEQFRWFGLRLEGQRRPARTPTRSTPPPSSSPPTRWPSSCPAGRTWTSTSRRSGRSSTPASRGRARADRRRAPGGSSRRGPSGSCCRRCVRSRRKFLREFLVLRAARPKTSV